MSTAYRHTQIDFNKVFKSSPNLYLLLSPALQIIGGSDAYIKATLTNRDEIIGRDLFDVFPDNPDDPTADGVSKLSASLSYVLKNRQAHAMSVQKYDIRKPDGSFEERYWSPLNTPVLNDENEVLYIIHRVEDVTELERTKREFERLNLVNSQKIREGEDRFHKIFNLCPVAIYITDVADGRFMYVNKAFEQLFLMNSEEVVGKTIVELNITDAKTRAEVNRHIKAKSGKAVELEVSLRIGNGELKRMLLSTEIIEVDSRKCFLVTLVDITERKKMEDEIRLLNTELEQRVIDRTDEIVRREKKFKALVEKNVDMMTLTLADGTVLYTSPSLTNILGYSFEEYAKDPVHVFVHPDDLRRYMEQMTDVIKTPGRSIYILHRILHKNGTYHWCEGTMTNMLDDPDIGALISNFRDISDRKKVEDEVRNAEKNYREIFDKASDAIYVHHIETGKVLEANQKACDITGFTKEEIINGSISDFITNNPDYSLQHAIGYLQKAAKGEPQLFEWSGKNKDGSSHWYEVSLKMATIAGEERILAFFREVNDRKMKEEEIKELNQTLEKKVLERTQQLERNILQLKESEEKFQKAFKASAAGITITRLSDATYLDANDAYADMTGYSKRELIGHTSTGLNLIVNPEAREKVLTDMKINGSVKHREISIRHRSGRIIDILFSMDTILINGEQYAIGISYDITERKKAEYDLKAVNKELEAFTYSVSHDLRAPLRAVTGFARILEEDYAGILDSEGRRLLKTISGNAVKMGMLIDDLLSFSRLGRKELQKRTVDMNELIKGVLAELNKNATHNAAIHTGVLLNIKCDPALMKQVLINLIGNALKYSSKKNVPVVEIYSELVANDIVYTIKDNGVGFDMRYVNKLFGVFQRLHSEAEFQGTGVGLAIVQRIIHKHDGRVWAEGRVDEGAKFCFSLPGS